MQFSKTDFCVCVKQGASVSGSRLQKPALLPSRFRLCAALCFCLWSYRVWVYSGLMPAAVMFGLSGLI